MMETESPQAPQSLDSDGALPVPAIDSEFELLESETERKWSRIRVYGFHLGSFNLLLPQGLYCELIKDFRLSILPNAPQHFAGLIPVRGNLIPVYQLQPLLGIPLSSRPYVLAMGSGQKSAALLISQKPVMQDFNELEKISCELDDVPESLRPSINGYYRRRDKAESQVWLSLDHVRLFRQLAAT